MNKKKFINRTLLYLGVIVLIILISFPLYWVLVSSFKTETEIIQSEPTFIPKELTLENYKYLITESDFMTYMGNSLLVSIGSMIITTVLAILASYSVTRLRFKGRKLINKLILLTYVFPGVLLFVPIYNLAQATGLYDKVWVLIIVNVTFCAPFSTWLLKSFFASIPKELEEAAMIDGTSKLGALAKVIAPLTMPGIATVAIYSFIFSWGEYMFSFILTISETSKTLPVGLASWMTMYTVDWGSLTSGAILVTVPVLILFAFLGKSFVEGLTGGAVKG